jgi:hypothetical protein
MSTDCRNVRWFGSVLLAVAGVFLLVGCTNSERPSTLPQTAMPQAPAAPRTASPAASTKTFVGTAGGTDAFVAVVVDGSRALAYVCNGVPGSSPAAPTIQAWFNGPSDGSTVDVSGPAGQVQLQLTDTTMTGTLTLADGRTAPVSGSAVTGDAGLYRAASGGAVAGWILSANAEQRGGFGFEGGGGLGVPPLTLKQTTINFRNLSNTQIAKVGITPIPIP